MNKKKMEKKSSLFCEDMWYSFTLCPKDDYQKWSSVARYKTAIKAITSKLELLCHCTYELNPEISNKGRIHFHGKLKIDCIVRFLLYDIKKIEKIGIYEIDEINDHDIWYKYCNKDKKVMLRYCKSIKTKYIITNIPKPPPPKQDLVNKMFKCSGVDTLEGGLTRLESDSD